MPVDLPLDQLRVCLLPQRPEEDFEAFWPTVLARSSKQAIRPAAEGMPFRVSEAHVERVSFDAFDGGRIVGWSIAPSNMKPHPTLIFFQDYGAQRLSPAHYLGYTMMGFTCLTFDTRQTGDSSDTADYGGGRGPGWLTSGLMEPDKYYLTRCYVDACRAIDFAATCMEVDARRIGVLGMGQGGAFALAAAALDGRVSVCVVAEPSYCHFGEDVSDLRRIPQHRELADWLEDRPADVAAAFSTLSYVEINNLAERINCPTLIATRLRPGDAALPGIFSAANRMPAREKLVDVSLPTRPDTSMAEEPMMAFMRRMLQPKLR